MTKEKIPDEYGGSRLQMRPLDRCDNSERKLRPYVHNTSPVRLGWGEFWTASKMNEWLSEWVDFKAYLPVF